MKKIIKFFAAFTISASMLTTCGNTDGATDSETIETQYNSTNSFR